MSGKIQACRMREWIDSAIASPQSRFSLAAETQSDDPAVTQERPLGSETPAGARVCGCRRTARP
jgi:hypothetical protein